MRKCLINYKTWNLQNEININYLSKDLFINTDQHLCLNYYYNFIVKQNIKLNTSHEICIHKVMTTFLDLKNLQNFA